MAVKCCNDGIFFGLIELGGRRTTLPGGTLDGPILNVPREVTGFYHISAAQYKCILDDVFQLPNVPRKIVSHQDIECVIGYPFDFLALECIEFLNEVLNQKSDVFTTAGKGREFDIDNIETVEQVFTKNPPGNEFG